MKYWIATVMIAALTGCATSYGSLTPAEQAAVDIAGAKRILADTTRDRFDAISELAGAANKTGGAKLVQRALAEDPTLKPRILEVARTYNMKVHGPSWRARHAEVLWALAEGGVPELRDDAKRLENIAIQEIRDGATRVNRYSKEAEIRAFSDPSIKFDALVRNLVSRQEPNEHLAGLVGAMAADVPAMHPARQWLDENAARRTWQVVELEALRPLRISAIDRMLAEMQAPATGTAAAFSDKSLAAVRDGLKDPFSARFRNVYLSDSKIGPMACGELNAKNSYGAYIGFKRFFSNGLMIEHDTDSDRRLRAHFEDGWRDYCSQQRATVPTPAPPAKQAQ